jgi:hypothetical protein
MIVRGRVGSQFSIYWRCENEVFSESQSMHVPYDGNAPINILEFNLSGISGRPAFFRLNCFHGGQDHGVGEILEILKVDA